MAYKKIWVAKCSDTLGKLFDYELSPRFESIYKCQQYIDKNLKDIEGHLFDAFFDILFNHCYVDGKKKCFVCLGGSFIRCYNLEQGRFADGFDF